jgi:hypothetical protein
MMHRNYAHMEINVICIFFMQLSANILYNVRSLMDTKCNLLGLQMTPLDLLHSLVSDSTSSYYNLSLQ